MQQLLLVINAGSSSIKFSIFEKLNTGSLECVKAGEIERIGDSASMTIKSFPQATPPKSIEISAKDHAAAIDAIGDWVQRELPNAAWLAIGHRVVHGAQKFVDAVIIDERILAALRDLIPLDPLHQPISIAAIERCQEKFKGVPQIACFDTAFHATQSAVATAIALPESFTEKGIRRYGFHGLSYQFVVSALTSIDPALAKSRMIVAHLGNGASLCAIRDGKSVATTMGFSVLDGLMMGTRCGSIDPGVLLYLLNALHVKPSELEDILYKKSGLLGVSGISNDIRVLLTSSESKAKEALTLYVYRIVREIGSLVAALQGLDGIIFTGGVGEHAAEIREQVIAQISWLGFEIDGSLNREHAQKISSQSSKLPAYVIHTDENLMIARLVLVPLQIHCRT